MRPSHAPLFGLFEITIGSLLAGASSLVSSAAAFIEKQISNNSDEVMISALKRNVVLNFFDIVFIKTPFVNCSPVKVSKGDFFLLY